MRDHPPLSPAGNSPARRRVRSLAFAGAVALILAACSSSDDESAQDRYCDAGQSLRSSVDALVNLDLLAEGTNGLEAAVQAVSDDVNTLRDTAADAAADDVEALDEAVSGLEAAFSDLGDDINEESASGILTAINGVTGTVSAVYDTLTDCS